LGLIDDRATKIAQPRQVICHPDGSKFVPPYFEGLSRSYTWIFLLIGGLNSGYSFIAFKNLAARNELHIWGPSKLSLSVLSLHILVYVGFPVLDRTTTS